MIFLLVIIIVSVCVIVGLFIYQHQSLKKGLILAVDRDPIEENPLSLHNLARAQVSTRVYIKEKIREFFLWLLQIAINLRKNIRKILDKIIAKLSKMAFPETPSSEPIRENVFLTQAENHKKNGVRGTIE